MRGMIVALILLIAAATPGLSSGALAGGVPALPGESPTLARIRHDGVLRCGSAIRPGLAFPDANHEWFGLHVEICRTIAAVVLGDPAKIEFYGYALRPDFDRIRTGADDVAFLTGSEMFANELFPAVLPGPAVFQQTAALMVWDSSAVRHVADVEGQRVCVEPGTGPERALLDHAATHSLHITVSGWMELEEMMDAFNVGRCAVVAGELTALAALRIGSEQSGHPSRILAEPLSVSPVMAATPVADPGWSLIVTWTIDSLLAAGPDGQPLPIAGAWLGLDTAWQRRVTAAGRYDEMLRRSLGDASPLGLPAGVAASWRDGGLLAPPRVD